MSPKEFDSHSHVQTAAQPAVQAAELGRLDPTAWDGTEDTDPAMNVVDVERGAVVEDVPPMGFVS